jgi:hypothetical protein
MEENHDWAQRFRPEYRAGPLRTRRVYQRGSLLALVAPSFSIFARVFLNRRCTCQVESQHTPYSTERLNWYLFTGLRSLDDVLAHHCSPSKLLLAQPKVFAHVSELVGVCDRVSGVHVSVKYYQPWIGLRQCCNVDGHRPTR